MKLAESIDLFRRRFRFTAKDDGVLQVFVDLKPTKDTFYVVVSDNTIDTERTRIQLSYMRVLNDVDNVAIKVITESSSPVKSDYHLIWTREGLATAAPKA